MTWQPWWRIVHEDEGLREAIVVSIVGLFADLREQATAESGPAASVDQPLSEMRNQSGTGLDVAREIVRVEFSV